jgi:hypothetical protein
VLGDEARTVPALGWSAENALRRKTSLVIMAADVKPDASLGGPSRPGIAREERARVLQLVYQEKSAELRAETETANRLMAGYVTLQLGLATWLFANPPRNVWTAAGILLADLLFAGSVWLLIDRNYGRRGEVLSTLQNAIDALELSTAGAYMPERAIQAEAYSHSWRPVHRAVVIVLGLMQLVPTAVALIRARSGAP